MRSKLRSALLLIIVGKRSLYYSSEVRSTFTQFANHSKVMKYGVTTVGVIKST